VYQVLRFDASRDIQLFWGVTDTSDFYQLDLIKRWIASNLNLHCTLTARTTHPGFDAPVGSEFTKGTVYDALDRCTAHLTDRDVYMAGPTKTMHESLRILAALGIPRERILVDSYGG
jgi:NAD(P)H-flavin reductase